MRFIAFFIFLFSLGIFFRSTQIDHKTTQNNLIKSNNVRVTYVPLLNTHYPYKELKYLPSNTRADPSDKWISYPIKK